MTTIITRTVTGLAVFAVAFFIGQAQVRAGR
jgi:hypothetical protein